MVNHINKVLGEVLHVLIHTGSYQIVYDFIDFVNHDKSYKVGLSKSIEVLFLQQLLKEHNRIILQSREEVTVQ